MCTSHPSCPNFLSGRSPRVSAALSGDFGNHPIFRWPFPLTRGGDNQDERLQRNDAAHWVRKGLIRRRAFGNVRRGTYVGRRYSVVPAAESGPRRRRWRVDNRITRALPPLPCPTLLAMPTVPKSLRKEKNRRAQRRSRAQYLANYVLRKHNGVRSLRGRVSSSESLRSSMTGFRENRDKSNARSRGGELRIDNVRATARLRNQSVGLARIAFRFFSFSYQLSMSDDTSARGRGRTHVGREETFLFFFLFERERNFFRCVSSFATSRHD